MISLATEKTELNYRVNCWGKNGSRLHHTHRKKEVDIETCVNGTRVLQSIGPRKCWRYKKTETKIQEKRKDVRKWPTFQDTYTLHKHVRNSFHRRRVLVHGIDDQWQIDLVDLSSLSRVNDNYKFLLTCIDVLSKYAWVVPMKDKSAKSLVDAVTSIFTTSKRMPNKIQADKG